MLASSTGLAQVACSEADQDVRIPYWDGFSGPGGEFMTQLVNSFITFPITWMFGALLYQFGGNRFSEDGTEVAFISEAGVQALTYLKEAQPAG